MWTAVCPSTVTMFSVERGREGGRERDGGKVQGGKKAREHDRGNGEGEGQHEGGGGREGSGKGAWKGRMEGRRLRYSFMECERGSELERIFSYRRRESRVT